MDYFLAIDIGASSGRVMAAHLGGGRLVLEEIYRFQNSPRENGGRLTWDVERLFKEVVNGLKEAGRRGIKPKSIGIDTWAVDYALLDKDDNLIEPVYCYRDNRGAAAAEKLHRVLPFERLYEKTGIQYQPFNTVYQLCDDKLCGRLNGAESFLMLPDYLNFLLTGVKRQEYTNATSTALVNAVSHTWDRDLIEEAGLKVGLFRELSQPCRKVGALKAELAAEIGFNAEVVLPATHDTASAVIAAPLSKNAPYISSGTWSLLGIEQAAAHTDNSSRQCNYSNEGSVDFTFRYQKNIMGLWLIQRVKAELNDRYSFAELADMARQCPTAAVVDALDKRFLAPDNMIAEIESAAKVKFASVGELSYCVFNSLALCYADSIKQLERLTGKKYDTLHIIGGGCNNTLLNELTALRCGKKVLAGPSEATAIGNIIIQMQAAGLIKDLEEARAVIRESFDVKEVEV